MADEYRVFDDTLITPVQDANSITPSDSTDLAEYTKAIYVGGDGDLRVQMISGANVTFTGVQGGQVYPFRIKRVFSTSTTATNLVGLTK